MSKYNIIMPTSSRYKERHEQPIDFEALRTKSIKDNWDNTKVDDVYGHSFDKDYTSPKPVGTKSLAYPLIAYLILAIMLLGAMVISLASITIFVSLGLVPHLIMATFGFLFAFVGTTAAIIKFLFIFTK